MAVKVRTKEDTTSVTDMSLLIETSDRYLDWSDTRLQASIVEETGIAPELALEVACLVRERVQELADKMGWPHISTRLIREIVEQELLNKGRRYKNRAKKYRTLGLSEKEITRIIENQSGVDNGNLGHNPDAVLFISAETMIKQYALKHVFPADVVEAHLSGDFSLHDLGAVMKVYAFSKRTEVEVKIGDREIACSLADLWALMEVPELVVDDQVIKELSGSVQIKDRGNWVSLERLIRHDEEKEMRTFSLGEGCEPCVTADHACVAQRDGRFLLIRADEVLETDLFVRVLNEC